MAEDTILLGIKLIMTVFLRMKKVVFLFDFNYLCVKTICSSALQWHKLVKKIGSLRMNLD